MRAILVPPLAASFANATDWNLPTTFIGCYELHALSQEPAVVKKNDFLPRTYVLTVRSTKPQARLSGQCFEVKSTDSNVHRDLAFSSWKPKNNDEFEIIWSTGFVANGVSLRKSQGEFRGKAQYSEDTDSHPIEPFGVSARQTSCKPN